MIVARYKQGKYLAIDLFVGDALGIPADAIVFGRTKSIMASIESQAPRFKPVPAKQASLQYPLYPRRSLLRTKSKRLPWPFAYSVQYRPRQAGPASRHVQVLASNIYQTLLYVIGDAPAKHVVIVPFSWRNPETLAYATIGSLLHIYPSIFQMPTRYTIAALENLDAFERLLDDPDRIRAALSAWTIHPPPLKRIARAFKRLPLPRAIQ